MKEIFNQLAKILESTTEPFWYKGDFLIGLVFNIVGLVLSWMAYREAKKAKEAADGAVRAVRLRSIVLELTEIVQGFDRLEINIQYVACRSLINETTRKINRLFGPLKEDELLNDESMSRTINEVEMTLETLRSSLVSVTPFGNENQGSPHTIYIAVENDFSILSSQLSALIGSLESRTIILPN